MTQQLVLKGTGFYLQDSSLGVGWGGLSALLLRALFFAQTQYFLAPQNAISQNHAQKFPRSLSVLKLVAQADRHPLWNVLLWI